MGKDAGERQLTLKQGKLPAASFSLKFHALAAERGWNEKASMTCSKLACKDD